MPRSEAILLTALRDTETNSSEGVRKLGLLSEIAEHNRRLWSKCREERLMAVLIRPREFCMIENVVAKTRQLLPRSAGGTDIDCQNWWLRASR